VAQDTTGVRDHITSGKNGFLYTTADDLEQSFESALNADRTAIGDAAHCYALANFDVADVDKVYFSCYKNAHGWTNRYEKHVAI
ncbi:MAG: hypothetical protein JKY94_09525, partial [Rhodobacteraceae bacterium]|nr:hypothetical protein [Paracoccaceae bacterium]